MTFIELLDALSAAALAEPNVNRVSSKSITELNARGNVDYAAVYLNLERVETAQDANTFNLSVIYVDRVGDDGNDHRIIQSVAITALNNILNRLAADNIDISINFPYIITPFWEKYADVCSGAFASVGILIPNFGECYE